MKRRLGGSGPRRRDHVVKLSPASVIGAVPEVFRAPDQSFQPPGAWTGPGRVCRRAPVRPHAPAAPQAGKALPERRPGPAVLAIPLLY
jgi:hypothetical protein